MAMEKEHKTATEKEHKTKNIEIFKIILLGDSGVGKTSLINQYVLKKFANNKSPLDFKDALPKDLDLEGKHVKLQIHDTCGQERHGAGGLEAGFFSNAKGCMLVYDVNDSTSFENLENWYIMFSTRAQLQVISNPAGQKSFPFIVLGNKCDIDGGKHKEGNHERAKQWCKSKGIRHVLTSAKDNKNVAEAFQHVAQLALNQEIDNFHSNGTPTNEHTEPIKPLHTPPTEPIKPLHHPPTTEPIKPSYTPPKPEPESSCCCCAIL